MLTPALFTRLRAAQLRSVREQELLSCRNWILICAVGHLLALVHPLMLVIHVLVLRAEERAPVVHASLASGAMLLSGLVLLLFWVWARYAPYRACLGSLLCFLAIHAGSVLVDPRQLAYGTVFKVLVILGLMHATLVAHGRRRAR